MRFLAVIFFGLFAGCAAMQKQFVETTCNKEGAFQKGYNDAQNGSEMNNYWVGSCPPNAQDLSRESYRQGYMSAKSQQPTQITINTGAPGSNDGWACKDAYGEKKCGYDCKEGFGDVKCARHAGHNCIQAYGEIRCGLHCREDYGQIKCDEYE